MHMKPKAYGRSCDTPWPFNVRATCRAFPAKFKARHLHLLKIHEQREASAIQ